MISCDLLIIHNESFLLLLMVVANVCVPLFVYFDADLNLYIYTHHSVADKYSTASWRVVFIPRDTVVSGLVQKNNTLPGSSYTIATSGDFQDVETRIHNITKI